jgi:endonuclease-3
LASFPFKEMVETLAAYLGEDIPSVTRISQREGRDPFLVLVGTLLSLRTKDEVTDAAMERLTQRAKTPQEVLGVADKDLETLIFPVGFYRTKARTLKQVSMVIIEKYGGRVPDTIDELLTIKGVGRKTANLVVSEAYRKPAICVDTHVHRISNRMAIVLTKTPHQTEEALRRILPKKYWIVYNTLLVSFGRAICKPLSPLCSRCPITRLCSRIGLVRSR